jgi:4-hydroxy-3-methylbut-2-enyl diphosphate reductase
VSPAIRAEAHDRSLDVIDATCPLVTKVHLEAIRFARQHYTILLIGHKEHEEIEGTSGEAPRNTVIIQTESDAERVSVPDPERVCYLTQTTLSLDETHGIIEILRRRFPRIEGPRSKDICYATENRQTAVKAIAPMCQLLLVVGSQNSSNSKRLVEVCRNHGVPAHLIDDCSFLRDEWLEGVTSIAVTAGASAPENLVQHLITTLEGRGFKDLEELDVVDEDVRFSLPQELQGGLVSLGGTGSTSEG